MLLMLTESEAIGASRLKYVGDESDDAEDAARYDEIHDVIERLTTKMNCEYQATERRLAAAVRHLSNSEWNLCTTRKVIN